MNFLPMTTTVRLQHRQVKTSDSDVLLADRVRHQHLLLIHVDHRSRILVATPFCTTWEPWAAAAMILRQYKTPTTIQLTQTSEARNLPFDNLPCTDIFHSRCFDVLRRSAQPSVGHIQFHLETMRALPGLGLDQFDSRQDICLSGPSLPPETSPHTSETVNLASSTSLVWTSCRLEADCARRSLSQLRRDS